MLKEYFKEIKISDIQLSRSGIFTLYATDVASFNLLLNEFAAILTANGQSAAKLHRVVKKF